MMIRTISFGGGVQTVALAVLAASGRVARPDAIIYAKTRDRRSTIDYNNEFDVWLRARGLSITTVEAERSLTDTLEDGNPVIPMYGSRGGQLPRVCTERWKIRIIRQELRRRGATAAEVMLGISLDEIHRMRDSDVDWAVNVYPLIDLRMTRRDCESVILAAGLPLPPKSACDVCPHRSRAGWVRLRRDDPEAFAAAVAMEARFDGLFLNDARKPLPIVVEEAASQITMMDEDDDGACVSGHCFG